MKELNRFIGLSDEQDAKSQAHWQPRNMEIFILEVKFSTGARPLLLAGSFEIWKFPFHTSKFNTSKLYTNTNLFIALPP